MRLSHLTAAVATAALLAGCGFGGPDYPTFGESAYRLEGVAAAPDGTATVQTVIYRDGPKMRVETNLPNYGQAAIVFDESTNAAYVLNPTGAAPAAQPAPAAAPGATVAPPAPAAGTVAPAPTTAPAAPAQPGAPAAAATIAPPPGAVATAPPSVIGVAVRVADADAPQPLEQAWAALGADNARSSGSCEVAGERGHEWSPREADQGAQRTACITEDGIVLRIRENDRVLFEATNLQRGPQAANLFGVPAGYQVIDPERVVQQVGETMEHLDSVTGATPAPAAPAPVTPAPAP